MISSRLFVKNDETINVSVYFTKDGSMDILSPAEYEALDEEGQGQYEELRMTFRTPNFAAAKMIMRTSLDDNGNMHMGLFNNAMLNLLAVGWNVTDEQGQEIPVDPQKLNEMRPDIARALIALLTDKLDEIGLYSSILLS